jgi:predicted dithiol-disulfide oxidoreductase (DUF899 family)
MMPRAEATPAEWLAARRALLAEEKAFTHAREKLAERRRALPWLRLDKPYAFDASEGRVTLADLFGRHSQLVVQHFMFHPDWAAGCPSCSFWTDNLDGIAPHLAARDVAFVLVSRAPLPLLEAYRARMGWRSRWVSSAPSDFNADMEVSFEPQPAGSTAKPLNYNYGNQHFGGPEAPGVSVFARDDAGQAFLTYGCRSRGIDALNGAYQILDLVPKGRDEAGLKHAMAWVRRHDEYTAA